MLRLKGGKEKAALRSMARILTFWATKGGRPREYQSRAPISTLHQGKGGSSGKGKKRKKRNSRETSYSLGEKRLGSLLSTLI